MGFIYSQNATVVDIELYFTEHSKSHLQSLQDQLGKGFIDMFPVTKHLIDICKEKIIFLFYHCHWKNNIFLL